MNWGLAIEALAAHTPRGQQLSCALVVDPAVVGAPIHDKTLRQLAAHRITPREITAPAPSLDSVGRLADDLRGHDAIIALGGGTAIDLVKLSRLVAVEPRTLRMLDVAQRSGAHTVQYAPSKLPVFVAIPTTLGTGTEQSRIAIHIEDDDKRLIAGACLVPDVCVIDPVATETLPDHLVRSGAFEAFARLVHPYIGALEPDRPGRSLPDALVEATVTHLVQITDQAVAEQTANADRAGHEGATVSAHLRSEIAAISSFSHSSMTSFNRTDDWRVKIWPIANELSSAMNVRKMQATGALWPTIWQRIYDGDLRLGSPKRLHRMWSTVRDAASAPIDARPAIGITELMSAWSVSPNIQIDRNLAAQVARTTHRKWGGGLPMLAGFTEQELESIVLSAATPMAVIDSVQICHDPSVPSDPSRHVTGKQMAAASSVSQKPTRSRLQRPRPDSSNQQTREEVNLP